jgi:integrase/recombinase XerD
MDGGVRVAVDGQMRREMDIGEEVDGVGVREEWRKRWTLAKRSPRTIETYRRGIDRWFAFCDQHGVDVFAAEQHHVDAYWHTFPTGARPATIARHLATVSSFYQHVLRHGRPAPIDHNPAQWVDRPTVDGVSRRAGLNKAQALALRESSLAKDARTAALVHLLLGTALRVSEAINATVGELGWSDSGERTLAVTRKGGKPDMVTIEPADWRVIEAYLAVRPDVPSGWLFATTGARQMSRQTAYRLVREVADEVTDRQKKIGPHSLRHTFATLALDAGEPIQEVQGALRHASSATTQRYDRALRERGRGASRTVAKLWEETPS